MTGADAMFFSKQDLETIEACILICLDTKTLDEDTEKDARVILEEVRIALDKDAGSVADANGDELRAEYRAAEGGPRR